MKRTLVPVIFGITITLIFAFLAATRFLPFQRLEFLLYDMAYQVRGKAAPPGEVIILGVDDRDIEKMGRWPWGRDTLASVIRAVAAMGPRVIVSDIILSEPSRGDDAVADAIKETGNLVLPIVFRFKGEKRRVEDDTFLNNAFTTVRNPDRLKLFTPITAGNVLLPLEKLSSGASALGHINMFPDKDGVLRWEVMAVEYDGEIYPSIDLQAARLFLGLPPQAMKLLATEGIDLGGKTIPTDPWGRSLIRYYGPERTFPYITVSDIMEGKVKPGAVKDKIVILGVTAVGVYDLRVTPASPAMPGVEKHANVIASILHNNFAVKADNLINLLVVLISGVAFSLFIARLRALPGALLSLAFLAVLFLTSYFLFFQKGVWIALSFPGNNILVIYLVVTAYRYATEERFAKRIRNMFSSYVTEKIVNELIRNPDLAKLGGERREITVLFSDIKDFTTFCEQNAPEEVVTRLNEYLGEMTQVVLSWDGTVDKFVGDMIVAFWGAPLPQEDHAVLAVKCALNMVKRLGELQEKWAREGEAVLDAGIGLNTGDMIVGNIGAEGKKMEYTVIGDNVNLGSRVEGLTRKYNARIIITESTLDHIRPALEAGRIWGLKVKGLEEVVVKGRTRPAAVYELVSLKKGEESVIIECEKRDAVYLTEK